jgi:AmmeMemoRadiSam system protein B
MRDFPAMEEDAEAHRHEHALEVELPFLQAQIGDMRFVPICVGTARLDVLLSLGEAIAMVMREAAAHSGEPPPLLVTSSDMNHYEPDALTRAKDARAIAQVLALDARGLHEVVQRENISMCGYAPTVAMLTAARALGATSAELIKYTTSADVSGDRSAVVGYAGIVVT